MPRRAPLLLLSLVALCLGANTVYRAGFGSKLRTDLPVYLAGARAVLAGEDPFYVHSQERGWPYVYPPTFAVLMIPFTALPLPLAAATWFLVSAAALAVGVVCFRRSLARDGPFRWLDDGVPLALVLIPSASAFVRGQLSPFLVGLLCLAVWALARRRDGWAGLLVSLATAIKLTPVLFLGWFLFARRWKALGAGLAGLVFWLVLLPMPFLGPSGTHEALRHYGSVIFGDYLHDPSDFTPAGRLIPASNELPVYPVHIKTNQSLASHVSRRTDGGWSRALLLLLLLLALGPVFLWIVRPPARGDPLERATVPGVALLAAPLLVAPIAWHHYHVALLPLLMHAVRWRPPWATPVLGAFGVLSLLHFVVWPWRDHGLLALGTTLVYGAFLIEAWRRPGD